MTRDAWILIEQGALAALADDPVIQQAEWGYWKDVTVGPDTFVVVNVVLEKVDLNTFLADNAADIHTAWAWYRDSGKVDLDYEDGTSHDQKLSYMKDVDGQPAAFDSPNWAHEFMGQGPRRFARSVSLGFSRGFS